MATANLHEVIQASILRKAELQLNISNMQSQKSLAISAQADANSLLAHEKNAVRAEFKAMFEEDEVLQEQYKDYTEIPDFEEAIDKITAKFETELEELAAWESSIDAQITTDSTELEELKAYTDSYKNMLTENISNDFNFGLNS